MAEDPTNFDTDFRPAETFTPELPVGFESLVVNAIDFLTQSAEEVESHPKYSVIHFCAGIELLLKARLLREHWSLVVTKPGEISKRKFEEGDFESVSMRQCFERLENVCGERLQEERESFLEL